MLACNNMASSLVKQLLRQMERMTIVSSFTSDIKFGTTIVQSCKRILHSVGAKHVEDSATVQVSLSSARRACSSTRTSTKSRRRWIQLTVQFTGTASYQRVFRRSSLHFLYLFRDSLGRFRVYGHRSPEFPFGNFHSSFATL